MPTAQIMKTILLWSMLSTGHCADFAAHSEILTHPTGHSPNLLTGTSMGKMTCTDQHSITHKTFLGLSERLGNLHGDRQGLARK
jgi:hypothetical protein